MQSLTVELAETLGYDEKYHTHDSLFDSTSLVKMVITKA